MVEVTRKKARGVFVNTDKVRCSIHESGLMVFNCIRESDEYTITLINAHDIGQWADDDGIDFWVFNYHAYAMTNVDPTTLRRLPGRVFSIVLETLPGNPFALCSPDDFDAYICLDPTLTADGKVYPFPRPLEMTAIAPAARSHPTTQGLPIIGTFGFPTVGKGFELVVDAVNREFDRAIVRINVPDGDFTGGTFCLHRRNYSDYLEELCRRSAKDGVTVEFTRDFLSKDELIAWCGANTLNCFLYTRRQPGLAATTDQAIISGRPLAVSDNPTFRHIHGHLPPYPFWSLRESIERSPPIVRALQEEWSASLFARRFRALLGDFGILPPVATAATWPVPATPVLARERDQSPVLLINHSARHCGIHEYGLNIHRALATSRRYAVTYAECDDANALAAAVERIRPQALVVNYNPGTMPWLTPVVAARYSLPKIEIVHEFTSDAPDGDASRFDHHLIQHPLLALEGPRLFSYGRLIPYCTPTIPAPPLPVIGSFGFGTPNKGFEKLVLRVQHEFDEALIRLNIPWNDIIDPAGEMARTTASRCRRMIIKDGVRLEITHDYLTQSELLDWLAANSLNAFFYDSLTMLGISSVADYALAVDRPFAVTSNPMFRHLHHVRPRITVEHRSLKEIIATGTAPLTPLRNDWSQGRFVKRWEAILDAILVKPPIPADMAFRLPAA